MKFSELELLVVGLEKRYFGNQHHAPPAIIQKAVHNSGANLQFFALDDTGYRSDPDQKIIVSIGSNYTQGPNPSLPRANRFTQGPPFVSQNLMNERGRLQLCLEHYRNHESAWVSNGLASSQGLQCPPENQFHFVMTNFCGWITTDKWQSLNLSLGRMITAELLFNQPHQSSPFDHLNALADDLSLSHANVLWVAHGIDSEAIVLARNFFRERGITEWLITPNLGDWRRQFKLSESGVLKFA